ncbi:hypothetical protein COT69_00890 [candidate division WWE3 bacterium CG09_land_8_20_14_0_10_39_24]|uniref:Uncharacterized protein n=2 Tax=Katanobacteria TaxID=422282 RepID=A0A2G9XCL6_UNCKA|nr:MAG: hypothetical protein AUJ94_00190 [bacterium CG2_30_40_12]OJI09347.1 MAG: hypothetical protein BK003_00870 [bacterium CG09_39_24]PIP04730.1 MAG: hypothetical protein COX53_00800 [candidate division WWE3 bacterium CG23_combo_of_CG06-09_8_20_14_all_40_14]PIS13051.1 MAG: hypothetical protein COT69_00890 [candidate division WWE3 bacterium CG09_land_8_20_14_0_10_39_24]PJE51889.1 MAG: hypothetical protein COV27_01040 [candidate division WWE3 bacterium CG10_big_fil_rev_8_21_14_0_10_39_14]
MKKDRVKEIVVGPETTSGVLSYKPEPELTIQGDLWPFLQRHHAEILRGLLEDLLSTCNLSWGASVAEFRDRLLEIADNPEAGRMFPYVNLLMRLSML